jgi:glycerol-3-phosphate O-acyltransferase
MSEDFIQAILAREEITRYLQGTHGQTPLQVRERIQAYVDELRTTQRYTLYRALQHPLYPILRKIERHVENIDIVRAATASGRVVYVSNHKSHTDYLIEPLILDDHGVRPPIIAAGINLFGGPLGLLNRHVTGAIPIRRNTKDPVYLITLKAYVAALLRTHDLLFYIEGGRSYSGELKPPKTGLMQAALQTDSVTLTIIPTAVAYDLVLEDRVLARQGVKRHQRPFVQELTEMVRLAVGYRSRVFVTFGPPISLEAFNPQSRKDVMELSHLTREAIGKLYKVLPTAVVASAMRASLVRRDLETRVEALLEQLQAADANLDVTDARELVDRALPVLRKRKIIAAEGGRLRVRNRNVLKYYARTIQHLLPPPGSRTH